MRIYAYKKIKDEEMIKRNAGLIGKLYINHIAVAVFGLMMTITARFIGNRNLDGNMALNYILGAVSVILYIIILYVNFWELGASDKIKVDGGRLKENIWTGLAVSAMANIPAFVFGILGMLSCYIENDFLGLSGSICNLYHGMYIFAIPEISPYFPPIYLFLAFPAMITGFVSYIFGVKGYPCLFKEPKKDRERKVR